MILSFCAISFCYVVISFKFYRTRQSYFLYNNVKYETIQLVVFKIFIYIVFMVHGSAIDLEGTNDVLSCLNFITILIAEVIDKIFMSLFKWTLHFLRCFILPSHRHAFHINTNGL